jgi:hypothetical protein
MATSGQTGFNLEFTDIVEEAFERAGREMRSGYDLRTARRSMNLMTIEWVNRGINMWTIEQGTIDLVPGVNTYALPDDTVDLMEHVIRTGANVSSTQADLNITRISVSTYATIPNKIQEARPIQVWVQRLSGETAPNVISGTNYQQYTDTVLYNRITSAINATVTTIPVTSVNSLASAGFIKVDNEIIYYGNLNTTTKSLENCVRGQANTTAASHNSQTQVNVPSPPTITVWPTPDSSTPYQFVYWRMRRIQDAGSGIQTADISFRFLPCITAGLAYYVAMKIPEGMERLQMLKAAYDEQFDLAAGEDREKATSRFVPRLYRSR